MEEAIINLLKLNIKTANQLMLAKRKIAKRYKIGILDNSTVLKHYKEMVLSGAVEPKPDFVRLLRKRAVRTMSGIAPVAVLTKPYHCPGHCAYCPTEPGVPQSYLSNEPAVMRAIRCKYNPFAQVQDRLRALVLNGHEPTKIELIVIGGTWSCLPAKYKYWYIGNCFFAANNFSISNFKLLNKSKFSVANSLETLQSQLALEQKKNEKAKYQIIGLTLETRPDYINEQELWQMRQFGCTRVELGVQAIDDQILKLNKRGHGVAEITEATKRLKDFGFKVTYHIMPGLPGSSAAKDAQMFRKLFADECWQPDQIKFYPTVVTKGSLLYKWWKAGKYKPYSDKALKNLIIKCKNIVPEYVRIIRLIRDIPKESIEAGNTITNLRQIMQAEGLACSCIRCREVGAEESGIKNYKLKIIKYQASGGEEYFIQAVTKNNKLLGFCRLRISANSVFGPGTALVRELHVYGELVPVGGRKKVQHTGLGKKLLTEAENIAKMEGQEQIAIIAGVGVRNYYKKQGYKTNKTYLIKTISS